ncbi:MAG: hypothetical protein DRH51_05530 [Candidatus Coatesbacteria bacterium]|nr:MAG: hypothetical protein DRH51_05530 [Candidatus Coatesbacteria bacterium]
MRWSYLKGLFLPILVLIALLTSTEEGGKTPPEWLVKAVLPNPSTVRQDDRGIYIGYNEEGEIVGYAGSGEMLGILPHGYGGTINIMVGIKSDGMLSGFAILNHSETPEYILKAIKSTPAEKLIGKRFDDPFVVGEDVDAVGRASITWNAIVSGVGDIAKKLAEMVGIGKTVEKTKASEIQLKSTLLILLATLTGVIISILYPENQKLRYLSLTVSFILLVFITGIFLSSQAVMPLLTLLKPTTAKIALYTLLGVALISTILKGRIYCGHICPLSYVFDGLLHITRYLRIPQVKPPEMLDRALGTVKYILLGVVLFICIRQGSITPAGYEPFALLTFMTANRLVIMITAVILVSTLFIPYFFCRYLCGVGAILSSFSVFTIKQPKIEESCNRCNICIDTCPLSAIKPTDGEIVINTSNCIRCGECIRACKKNAIKL